MPRRPHLELTTVATCKMACSYCPQKSLAKAYSGPRRMSMELFTAALDNLPQEIDVHFSGFAEPWLNEHATEMFLESHRRGHRMKIFSTLEGMSVDDLKAMSSVRLPVFGVHLPDAEGDMNLTPRDEYLQVLSIVADRSTRLTKKASFAYFGTTHPACREILDKRGIKGIDAGRRTISRAGNVAWIQRDRRLGSLKCRKDAVGRQPVMMPSGDLYLCCCDYSLKHWMGNLACTAWSEIWRAKPVQEFKEMMHQHNSDIICRSCEYARRAR